MGKQPGGEPFIVPIVIPMIAGPSVLAMLMLLTQNGTGQMSNWLYALLLAWGLSAVLLLAAPFLYKILRERGLHAIERLMGMILVMMVVQMLIDGIKVLF